MKRLGVRKVYVHESSASHSTSCCEMRDVSQAFKLPVIRYARRDSKPYRRWEMTWLLLECIFETNTHHPVDMLDVSNVYGSRYCRPRVFPVPLSAPRSTSASRSRRAVASETLVSSRYIVFVITPCSLTYCIACCMRVFIGRLQFLRFGCENSYY